MTRQDFWETFTPGEIYLVRGELVELVGYNPTYDEAVFHDEDGNRVACSPGLIRLVN